MTLADRPVRDLLAAFASSDPTPGGGSAAAVASAIGTSLLQMVAGLPKTRSGTDADRMALAEAADALPAIQRQLTAAIDDDTSAYDAVVAAYKQAKATDAEQAARKASIQGALRGATEVPLGVMRLSAESLRLAMAVAAHGHKAAASDVGVAVALLKAGLHGARLNVEANLGGLSDADYKTSAGAEVTRLIEQAEAAARAAERSMTAG
jgi:formiminotetrahydrofolate cyclodeaminase